MSEARKMPSECFALFHDIIKDMGVCVLVGTSCAPTPSLTALEHPL